MKYIHTPGFETLELVSQSNKKGNSFDLWETISPSELIQRHFFSVLSFNLGIPYVLYNVQILIGQFSEPASFSSYRTFPSPRKFSCIISSQLFYPRVKQ